MSSYAVGKIGSIETFRFDNLGDAERKIEEFEKVDPEGVHSGSYFIDGPEGGIDLFNDPNKCADYIERNQLNEGRGTLNPYVVEILGNTFVASKLKDCWDREHEYFEITYKAGKRVLKGDADNKRRLTLLVSPN